MKKTICIAKSILIIIIFFLLASNIYAENSKNKKIYRVIKNGSFNQLKNIIEKNPDLINTENEVNAKLKKLSEVMESIDKITDRKKRFVIGKYFLDTYNYLLKFTSILQKDGNIIIIIGDSMSEMIQIPTRDLILNIASKIGYQIEESYIYLIKNKRMNYTRRNDANIKTEKILVLRWIGG